MTDFAIVQSILGCVKTAAEIANLLGTKNLSLEKAEFKLKLAELISLLADAKIELSEIQKILLEKDSKIQKLKDQLLVTQKVKWEAPSYWLEENEVKEGPFCQKCYDSEKKLIRLQGNGSGYWECKNCGNGYKDKTYEARVEMVRRQNRWTGY